jgi:hypothetical protein
VHDLTAPLVARRRVSGRMWVLRFAAGEIASEVRGGQFVNLLLRPGPLLRRPFSVWQASPEEGWVEVLLEAVGVGTRLLVALCDGEAVSMLGPLGNGYTLDAGAGSVALLSGGLGVAPMAITARDAHTLGLRVHWVHGARSEDELCTEWEGDRVHWATDDGTRGHRGTALDAVPDGEMAAGAGRCRDLHGLRNRRLPRLRGPPHQRHLRPRLHRGAGLPGRHRALVGAPGPPPVRRAIGAPMTVFGGSEWAIGAPMALSWRRREGP